jgi:ATP-dependent helicase/nuclease subunit A
VFSGALEARVTASSYVAHAAHRLEAPGRVVVLPRFVRASGTQPEDWTEPFDAPTAAEMALAEQIAGEIGRLLGTHLPSGKRVRAGEILILTRKRGAFVTAMNRALRAHAIPAAGADRIPVATHMTTMDLLALADVMLLPEDDLQLAACLKSPLLGVSEHDLMQLATERGEESLWSALTGRTEACFAGPASRLKAWRGMADQVTPFRFFATVLGPDGGRRAFRERLGGEADDVLDAFLSQALSYEAVEPPSLQGFLRTLRASQTDIKREAEEAGAGVRIMTVHGAKGLEADVVFLADTGSQIVHPSHRAILVDIGGPGDPAFLWRRPSQDAAELQKQADGRAADEAGREYLRLLYVAMTRARDALYLCGIRSEKKEVDGCWYSLVQRALVLEGTERDAESGELLAPYHWPQPPRAALPPAVEKQAGDEAAEDFSPWLFQPAPSPAPAPQPLRPSRALAEPDPRRDFSGDQVGLAGAELGLVRGRLVHKLLQSLPELAARERAEATERLLRRELRADAALAEAIRREVEAVLADPGFVPFLGPNARAEAPIVGHVETERGGYAVSGRIDRLLRDDNGWRILDFKTNREPPVSEEAIDPATVLQLALYRRLLQGLEPGVPVEAAVMWTAGPKLMPVPPPAMEQALAELGIGETPVA